VATLTQDILDLLDRIYNYRSAESTIIGEINDDISRLENLVKEETEKSNIADNHRAELTNTLEKYTQEKEDFEKRFEGLDDHTYDGLRAIGIDLEIGTWKEKVAEKNASYIDSLTSEIATAKQKVDESFSKISSYSAEIDDRHHKLIEAETHRSDLNDLFDQALSSDAMEKDSISKAYVKETLANLGKLNESEINELAKLIMFPEDGLAEYDKNYEERKNAGFPSLEHAEPVVAEETVATENDLNVSAVYSETEPALAKTSAEDTIAPNEEEQAPDEVVESSQNSPELNTTDTYTTEVVDNGPIVDITSSPDETISPLGSINLAEYATSSEEIKNEEQTPDEAMEAPTSIIDLSEINQSLAKTEENPEEEARSFLTNIGLDADKIANESSLSVSEFYEAIKDTDEKTLTNNIDLLKSLNAEDVIPKFENNNLYITDSELSKKITYFRSLSIKDTKITDLLINHSDIMQLPLTTIEERAKALKATNGELTSSNITELAKDTVTFANNLESLKEDFGFELDEKEVRNFKTILGGPSVIGDANILKEYNTPIIKKNGRYALEVFAKTPNELRTDLDLAIEEKLSELLSTNPEILGLNMENLVSRIKYCQEHGESLDSTSDYINYADFDQKYPNAELPKIISSDEALANYHEVTNNLDNKDYIDILTAILDTHYQNEKEYQEIKLSNEVEPKYTEIFNQINSILKSEMTDENTLTVDNTSFSEHRIERNLKILVQELLAKGESLDGVSQELILVSTLYASRKTTAEMEQVTKVCLGFNEEKKLGGPTL